MNKFANIPVDQLDVQPMSTLTESEGFVLIIADSGYTTTPFAAHVGRRDDSTFRDYSGEGIRGTYGQDLLGWMPLPFEADAVHHAVQMDEKLRADPRPVLQGDVLDHIIFIKSVIHELSDAIGARRAMLRLHAALGDDIDGPDLPIGTDHSLVMTRKEISHWVRGTLADAEAIAAIGNLPGIRKAPSGKA
jgi:hypothetical protein